MQCFGRDIGAVRPADRPELVVKLNLGEIPRTAKRLEDAAPVPVRRVKLAADAVVERQAEPMLADDVRFDDPV